VRAIERPFYGATLNLDWVLMRLGGELGERISDQGAWTGKRLSDMTAQLDRWSPSPSKNGRRRRAGTAERR